MIMTLRNEEPLLERFTDKEEILIAQLLMTRKSGMSVYDLWTVLSADYSQFIIDGHVIGYTIDSHLPKEKFNVTAHDYLGVWVNFNEQARIDAKKWLNQHKDVTFSKRTYEAIEKVKQTEKERIVPMLSDDKCLKLGKEFITKAINKFDEANRTISSPKNVNKAMKQAMNEFNKDNGPETN